MTTRLQDKINGEHELAEIGLKLLPLIEKHFKPFDGQRAIIASGSVSAKFDKVCKAFRLDVEQMNITGLRTYISSNYSVSVNFDINRRDSSSEFGVIYYKDCIYFGEVDTGTFQHEATGGFTYKLDIYAGDGYEDKATKIIATTESDIENARQMTRQALDMLEKAKASIPYTFKEQLPTY